MLVLPPVPFVSFIFVEGVNQTRRGRVATARGQVLGFTKSDHVFHTHTASRRYAPLSFGLWFGGGTWFRCLPSRGEKHTVHA